MRFLPFGLLFGLASLARPAVSAHTSNDPAEANTHFNGKEVPPILELSPANWEEETKKSKFLFVKHYSPYCPHCTKFAPTFQTLHEFYYTSHPSGAGNENADFTTFYNFRFAMINCVAYFDLCSAHEVSIYPTSTLYKDGEPVDSIKGAKGMDLLSELIEGALESDKPGTRPSHVELPQPGDTEVPKPVPEGEASSSEETQSGDAKAADEKKPDEGKSGDSKPDEARSGDSKADDSKAGGDAKSGDQSGNDKANTPSPSPSPTSTTSTPTLVASVTKPTVTTNPNGLSVSLSAETFQTLVTMTQEPWFIKFYAPWCPHCKAMAATWAQFAKSMQGKLNIGEVNCDVETRLCKDVRLRGFPTILFFRGGERVEYDGLRGLGDFVQYAEKAIDSARGVQEVDAAALSALEEQEDVIFVYFYDHATTSEDFIALERLPLSLTGHAKLVKTKDPELYERFKISTWPRLLVTREGRPTYYTPLTPKEMRDRNKVLEWMQSVWLPIVPELTASNAREIMDGKLVVLGVLNRDDQDSFQGAIREMKSAASEWIDKQIQLFQLERQELRDAKQLRIEEAEDRGDQRALRAAKSIRINMDKSDRKEVAFAWVDGNFWQRWIRTTYGIDIKDGERVVINDEDNRRYWDQTITGNYIIPSRTSILETLNKVTAQPPKLKAKLTISNFEKVFFDIRLAFIEHPYLSVGGVLGLIFGCVTFLRARRRNRGHFRLDDSAGMRELKGPLLGGVVGTNGKKD